MAVIAPVLGVGRAEVDAAHPGRDKRSDGWIGNKPHAATGAPENGGSRHNVNKRDRVDAWDCDTSGTPGNPVNWTRLLACWARHPSAQNFIHNRKIWSRSWGWTPKAYTGDSDHTEHAHVECRLLAAAEVDVRPWGYYTGTKPVTVPVVVPTGSPQVKGGMSKLPVLRRNPRLWKGANGQLQRALRKLGYSLGRWGVDFKFGDATRAAVKAFQRDHHLSVDGVVGNKTWTALAQALLGGITVDAKFGPHTLARVTAFQKSAGLTADGIIGPRTWGRLIG